MAPELEGADPGRARVAALFFTATAERVRSLSRDDPARLAYATRLASILEACTVWFGPDALEHMGASGDCTLRDLETDIDELLAGVVADEAEVEAVLGLFCDLDSLPPVSERDPEEEGRTVLRLLLAGYGLRLLRLEPSDPAYLKCATETASLREAYRRRWIKVPKVIEESFDLILQGIVFDPSATNKAAQGIDLLRSRVVADPLLAPRLMLDMSDAIDGGTGQR